MLTIVPNMKSNMAFGRIAGGSERRPEVRIVKSAYNTSEAWHFDALSYSIIRDEFGGEIANQISASVKRGASQQDVVETLAKLRHSVK